MDKRMSRQELGELIFCVASLAWCFLMMAFAIWGIVTRPWFRSPMGNLFGSIFIFTTGLVGFVLYCWVFVVLTRGVISIHDELGGVIVQPRIGKPIRIDLSRSLRAHIVRTVPYAGTPSQKALLFLKPGIFVVPQSHPAWEHLAAYVGQKSAESSAE